MFSMNYREADAGSFFGADSHCVGIANTKTLAQAANHAAKNR